MYSSWGEIVGVETIMNADFFTESTRTISYPVSLWDHNKCACTLLAACQKLTKLCQLVFWVAAEQGVWAESDFVCWGCSSQRWEILGNIVKADFGGYQVSSLLVSRCFASHNKAQKNGYNFLFVALYYLEVHCSSLLTSSPTRLNVVSYK